MNDTPWQLTLRELRTAYTSPIGLTVMFGVGVIAGITGPFNTFAALPLGPRLAYWLAIVLMTYGAGVFGGTLAEAWLLPKDKPLLARILIAGVGASVPVTAAVVAISALTFPDLGATGISLWMLYLYCLAISLALMVILDGVVVPRTRGETTSASPQTAERPPILERLPRPVRGEISHMSMADHYVEVFTQNGRAMVLMRLSDAIAETRGVDGLRIHRSHWVAKHAVAGLKRVEGRVVVELKSGEILPVSRSYLDAVRADFPQT